MLLRSSRYSLTNKILLILLKFDFLGRLILYNIYIQTYIYISHFLLYIIYILLYFYILYIIYISFTVDIFSPQQLDIVY